MDRFGEFDAMNAEILKGLKDYQETAKLPSEVANFQQAEEIAERITQIHVSLEERTTKYEEKIKLLIELEVETEFRSHCFFVPNSTPLIKAQVHHALIQYTNDSGTKCKLLEMAIEDRREFRSCIWFGDVLASFLNELYNLQQLIELVKIKSALQAQNLDDLKGLCDMLANYSFVASTCISQNWTRS